LLDHGRNITKKRTEELRWVKRARKFKGSNPTRVGLCWVFGKKTSEKRKRPARPGPGGPQGKETPEPFEANKRKPVVGRNM